MMRFEQLHVWQRFADLACEVYIHFKTSKEFGLKDQITRSALSISSNIAEGMSVKRLKVMHVFYDTQKEVVWNYFQNVDRSNEYGQLLGTLNLEP
ncbi:four helix bundle protein [Pseudoalteromonas haloplanktis]|uniref:Four helix bundle protein n=1 Tax=Pseudoalteromonas haloplanktis TaxID=228 RepID=A0ABU1BEA3_PSEHA|nr:MULTISPECIES: four helix bundle protein [Pseudoalteromonas]MDQ9091859.1 four helix bundle protein [Pseudoalteromonas haloplanktis]